jgi:hypothetical protein
MWRSFGSLSDMFQSSYPLFIIYFRMVALDECLFDYRGDIQMQDFKIFLLLIHLSS